MEKEQSSGKTAQPAESVSAGQEAPPVKTVQPIGEAVVTEPEKKEEQPEAVSGQAAVSADPGGSPAPVEEVSTADEDKVAALLKSRSCYSCDLSGLNLSGKNLKGADLEKANLTGCNLEGASLDRANLKGAILVRANLRNASLQGADLYKADFTGADLTDANMKKVQADDALFTDAIGVSEEILKKK
ncbi:MAG: pentapeptide repeat-containing protein [Desulfobulbaceae bacterium]|nr:MAG: pentapeptide repeat-containing protein [Desulfobulbaceae bacterium]